MSKQLGRHIGYGLLVVVAWLGWITPVQAGEFLTRFYNGYTYKLFVPEGYNGAPLPLVILLHGCTQSADDFANATQMNELADSQSFFVLYPEQRLVNNSSRCWNWFEPENQERSGELADVMGMVEATGVEFALDANRIYAAGFSAGAAMAVNLGVAYPDQLAAIGVASGLEYQAALNSWQAFLAMSTGGPEPNGQGVIAYQTMGGYARPVPVLLLHGDADYTVNPINGAQALTQWAQTNDLALNGVDDDEIDDVPEWVETGVVPGGRTYTHAVYTNDQGQVYLEKYDVQGMGHVWSGGPAGGSFTDPQGPDASALLAAFFAAHPMVGEPDITPPVTTATPPGGSYSGSVTVTLTSNEAAETWYRLNDQPFALYSAPLVLSETSSLTFYSVDLAGNSETPQTELYTLTPPTQQTLSSIAPEDGYVGRYAVDGRSPTLHQVGDKGMYNSDTYRVILSFDTSLLPAGSTPVAATLRLYRQSLAGAVNSVQVDIRAGTFGSAALERQDYAAAASASAIATAAPPPADGAYVDIPLPASALAYLNLNGRTQFRLRAATPLNFAADILTLYGGEAGVLAPQLIVEY